MLSCPGLLLGPVLLPGAHSLVGETDMCFQKLRFWIDLPAPRPWGGPFSFQNAALFWWNLHRSGKGDSDTLHAGCPVLVGDKWGKACLSGHVHAIRGSQ